MLKWTIVLAAVLAMSIVAAHPAGAQETEADSDAVEESNIDMDNLPTVPVTEISLRDPFVLPVPEAGYYYIYGTGQPLGELGFDAYRSRDLETWEGPFPIFRPDEDFWGTRDYWAPEVHRYEGRYYLFATYAWEHGPRGTQISVSDSPAGPFEPLGDWAQTPRDWQSLDGTLFIEDGKPWMVFCHEWIQIGDGGMCKMPLSDDLSEAIEEPTLLFNASDAPWAHPFLHDNEDSYVTDGPWLHRLPNDELIMLWSSFGPNSLYKVGIARSESGTLAGPWVQDEAPIYTNHGGHPMLFETFDGQLIMSLHAPNHPREAVRVQLIPMEETEDDLRIKEPRE